MTTLANITHRDPDILSGTLVFAGTQWLCQYDNLNG
jgi:hypothetical protein